MIALAGVGTGGAAHGVVVLIGHFGHFVKALGQLEGIVATEDKARFAGDDALGQHAVIADDGRLAESLGLQQRPRTDFLAHGGRNEAQALRHQLADGFTGHLTDEIHAVIVAQLVTEALEVGFVTAVAHDHQSRIGDALAHGAEHGGKTLALRQRTDVQEVAAALLALLLSESIGRQRQVDGGDGA